MRDEIAVMYDGLELDGDTMPRAGQAELSPPQGVPGGLARRRAGLLWRRQAARDRICEIKKMYVVPDARGTGLAGGCCTHSRQGPGARLRDRPARHRTQAGQRAGLYESEGYAAIEDFNGNPVAVFWGEKPLRIAISELSPTRNR